MVLSLLLALLLSERNPTVELNLNVGDVAARDIRSSVDFPYTDEEATLRRQREAVNQVAPVYDHDIFLSARLQQRVADAFELARLERGRVERSAEIAPNERSDEQLQTIALTFCSELGLSLDPEERRLLIEDGFSQDLERVTQELIARSMRHYIVGDMGPLENAPLPISVIRILEDSRRESLQLEELSDVRMLAAARQEISLYVVERFEGNRNGPRLRVAAALARASIRANFFYNQRDTEQLRQQAAQSVLPVSVTYPEGTVLIRQGNVISEADLALVQAFQASVTESNPWIQVSSLFLFCFLLCVIVYAFARTYVRKFAHTPRELVALAALLATSLGIARLFVEISVPLSQLHPAIRPSSLWLIAPLAGFALIVRILMNSETCLVFSVVLALLCGILMDQNVLFMAFFVLSCLTAAGAIGKDRKRRTILWAGVVTGLVNAGYVLLMGLVQAHQPELGAMAPTPFWDVTFAFAGGLLAGVLALGLIPLFELFGFVTDHQLLELANLDHPLLRDLMLQAPGTYHHSIIVGTLAEAAAEAIGCNALSARVCCYFHDIGKTVKPQYFTENQQDGLNPHDQFPGHMSAQLIIDHVRNGGAQARQYKLPQPIIDAIYTHHGTGVLKHFYAKAKAENPDVNEADFRYPGPKPYTREQGIIMLADKTEAACRSIKEPTPERISVMIQKIINGTIQDGQFDECPLTVKEIFIVAQSFEQVLLGIYHQRIEYPDTRSISSGDITTPREAVITLEIPTTDLRHTENLAESLSAEPPPSPPTLPHADLLAPETLPPTSIADIGAPGTHSEGHESSPNDQVPGK